MNLNQILMILRELHEAVREFAIVQRLTETESYLARNIAYQHLNLANELLTALERDAKRAQGESDPSLAIMVETDQELRAIEDRRRSINRTAHGVEQCPACCSLELRSAEINDRAGVSCADCKWMATYAYLREQATEGRGGE